MDMHGNDYSSPNESKQKLTNDSREEERPSIPPLSEMEQPTRVETSAELVGSRPSRDVSNLVLRKLFGDSSRVGISQGQGSGVTRDPDTERPSIPFPIRERPTLSELEMQIQAHYVQSVPTFAELVACGRPTRDVCNQVLRQLFGDSSRVGISQGQGSVVTRDPQNIVQRGIQPSYGPPERKDKKGLNLVRRSGWPLSDQELSSLMQMLRTQNEQIFLGQLGAGGFWFEEVTCHRLSSISESFFSCDFSSDGKFLACAGRGGKVTIWKKEYSNFVTTAVTNLDFITEVRFCPGSIIYATSSFDGTVQVWRAAYPTSIITFSVLKGGTGPIMSLDFHPIYPDILCWCYINDSIQLWNICNGGILLKCFRGGARQVRFQPRLGKLLATASGMFINIFETDSYQIRNQLQGHSRDVLFICWHQTGNFIASVSEDEACIWSAASDGKLLSVLHCQHGKFESCIFHPGYPNLLIISGRKYLEFWIPTTGQTLNIPQDGVINGLATSPQNQLVASVSYDCVKLWKCS